MSPQNASSPSRDPAGCRVVRRLIGGDPFSHLDAKRWWLEQGVWPANWIGPAEGGVAQAVMIFRLRFEAAEERRFMIHVAGDERYELFLDERKAGWGSERGSAGDWAFDSYEVCVPPGIHEWRAEVWVAGKFGLRSQVSVEPGFLLASDWEELNTGAAAWEMRVERNVVYSRPFPHDFFSVGWNTAFARAKEPAAAWAPAPKMEQGSGRERRNRYGRIHLLTPAQLPVAEGEVFRGGVVRHIAARAPWPLWTEEHLAGEAKVWEQWLREGEAIVIPAGTERHVLIDLEDYVCARPEITARGDGAVSVSWAEALHGEEELRTKGNRDEIEGKYFHYLGDTLFTRGTAERYRGPFIRTGRYVLVSVAAGAEALVLEELRLERAEYPLEISAVARTDSPELDRVLERCRRTIRASCHDAIIDGPYYEQMQWIGDIGQAALALYTMSADARLVRKALETFDHSRGADGLMPARWPARDSLFIPGFCLHWIGVLHDFALWRDESDFVRERLPGMRAVLDRFLAWTGADGLVRTGRGWRFTDWVPGWADGIAPHDSDGASGTAQWQLIRALSQAERLEAEFGDKTMEARYRQEAQRLARAAEVFWNEEAGAFSDRREEASYSEHTQAYALLSGCLDKLRREQVTSALADGGALTRATPAFGHYVFEALHAGGRAECIVPLEAWYGQEKIGLLTTPETGEPTRSDCHGWSAHPHYHFYASLLGIRPGSMGFRTVVIEPRWECFSRVEARIPHPCGEIAISIEAGVARISLPENIGGIFRNGPRDIPLSGGENIVRRCG